MPCNNKKKKERTFFKYSAKTMDYAIEAVRDGRLSMCGAVRKFNIPKGTLSNRLKGLHPGKLGRPPAITEEDERYLLSRILLRAQWGFPINKLEIRLSVKHYLDYHGKLIKQFPDNLPGLDWVRSFVNRHNNLYLMRNIKRSSPVTQETLTEYHNNLSKRISNHSLNQIFAAYKKYPEDDTNHSESSVSVMFCCSADGTLLPPFSVYKSTDTNESWTKFGPKGEPCCTDTCCKGGSRRIYSESSLSDLASFERWMETCFLPHAKNIPGSKILISDNQSSLLSENVFRLCEENDISFLCLPLNASHLTQPLDVAFFGSLKVAWKKVTSNLIKENNKKKHPSKGIVDEDWLPFLLKQLFNEPTLKQNIRDDITIGFRDTGICPLDVNPLLNRFTGMEK